MALFKRKKEERTEKEELKQIDKEPTQLPAAPSLPKGGDARSYQVILSPHITEKGTVLGQYNKYVFKIDQGANKIEVKKAVESLYKVEVARVHMAYAQSKSRQVGKYKGHKPGFKKAVVTLKEGSKIDLAQ